MHICSVSDPDQIGIYLCCKDYKIAHKRERKKCFWEAWAFPGDLRLHLKKVRIEVIRIEQYVAWFRNRIEWKGIQYTVE